MDACPAKLMCDCKLEDFINGDRLAEAVDQRMDRKALVIMILSGHSGGPGVTLLMGAFIASEISLRVSAKCLMTSAPW